MQKLAILGASHAFWEISDLINDINAIQPTYEIIAVYDDNSSLWGKKYGSLTAEGPLTNVHSLPKEVKLIFAIGSFKTRIIRAEILNKLNLPEDRFETLIHPTAKIYSTSIVKSGCIIHYGTVIFNHTVIEPFVIISANCVVGVGNYIGKGSLFGSNVTTTTGVKIGSYSFIGSSVTIAENIELEPGVHVGLASLIIKDIKAGQFAFGNPAKILDKIEVPQHIIDAWTIQKETSKLI
jgi:UDP-3-O-[3-hydroxymyristoyl] glucosamine N-acyltransferase